MRTEKQIRGLAKHMRDALKAGRTKDTPDDQLICLVTAAVADALEWAAGENNQLCELFEELEMVDVVEKANLN